MTHPLRIALLAGCNSKSRRASGRPRDGALASDCDRVRMLMAQY